MIYSPKKLGLSQLMIEISQPEMVLPWGVTNIEGAMP